MFSTMFCIIACYTTVSLARQGAEGRWGRALRQRGLWRAGIAPGEARDPWWLALATTMSLEFHNVGVAYDMIHGDSW